jgi:hypothetical protein
MDQCPIKAVGSDQLATTRDKNYVVVGAPGSEPRYDICPMLKIQKSAATKIVVFVLLVAGAFAVASWRERERNPLGEAPPLNYASSDMPESERQHFLDGDFTIIKDMRALPGPVLRAFTEQGGSRLVIANPGRNFVVGDVIYDSSVPRMRLLFAGVLSEKCFIYYEQGGRGHMYILALFDVTSSNAVKPLWRGYCRSPAADFSELRSQLVRRDCR